MVTAKTECFGLADFFSQRFWVVLAAIHVSAIIEMYCSELEELLFLPLLRCNRCFLTVQHLFSLRVTLQLIEGTLCCTYTSDTHSDISMLYTVAYDARCGTGRR